MRWRRWLEGSRAAEAAVRAGLCLEASEALQESSLPKVISELEACLARLKVTFELKTEPSPSPAHGASVPGGEPAVAPMVGS